MDGKFLEIHRSKFELDPCGYCGQPSIGCITHRVFFFRICKDALNGLRTQGVGRFAKRRVPDVLRSFYVRMPDVALNGFGALLTLSAAFTDRAAFANVAFTLVFPIALAVGSRVAQDLVLRTEDAIVIFIVNRFIPRQVAFLRHRTLIGQGWDSPAVEDLLADPGRFVPRVGRNDLNLRIVLCQSLEYRIKRNAVMDIAGSDLRLQHVTALVADGMRLVCEQPPVTGILHGRLLPGPTGIRLRLLPL